MCVIASVFIQWNLFLNLFQLKLQRHDCFCGVVLEEKLSCVRRGSYHKGSQI